MTRNFLIPAFPAQPSPRARPVKITADVTDDIGMPPNRLMTSIIDLTPCRPLEKRLGTTMFGLTNRSDVDLASSCCFPVIRR